ncbi:MAG: hypothetical protein JWM57_1288 [Phycisphaerales bacterium]|nr:hypothetical protein [Phycisphaerales bacterium]
MDVWMLRKINTACFRIALLTIVIGVLLAVAGIWGLFPTIFPMFWKLLGTDIVVFLGAIFTNMAIMCYANSDGSSAGRSMRAGGPGVKLPTPEEYAVGHSD